MRICTAAPVDQPFTDSYARACRREWQPTRTTVDIEGRKVYQLAGPRPSWQARLIASSPPVAHCVLLFAIDATSSVEAAVAYTGADPGCANRDLPATLAGLMPPTDNRSAPPRSDRPADVFATPACSIVEDLASSIEPKLPLIIVEPIMPLTFR